MKAAGTTATTGRVGIASSNSMPAKPAPLVTPMMSGAASGLRITPCITAPDTASAMPTSQQSRTRGNWKSITIREAWVEVSPTRARSTSPSGTSVAPTLSP